MEKQKTITREVSLKGIGLHTANKVKITFKPADVDSGINFIRTDLEAKPVIKASVEHLLSQERSPRRTSLGKDSIEIHTIEHLMAALAGRNIDNLNIEIDSDEVPGLDGSSAGFMEVLAKAGIREQAEPRRYYPVKEAVFIEEDDALIMALPSSEFKISYTLSYNHPLLKAQFLEMNFNQDTFKQELSCARTFCLEEEAKELQQQGLGKGANYENTLVVGKKGVLKNKLRYPDEFIRHKMLDLLGDLYLFGQPLRAHIIALRSGHPLNLKLVKKIDQQRKRYALGGVGIARQPQEKEVLDREAIMNILPHRDPFLFVDQVTYLERGKHATGIKNLTLDDYFFKGHFPGRPIMPGVLIIEAMAQLGGIMMLSGEKQRGKLTYFMSIDNAKFRKAVVPGDQLVLDVEAEKVKSRTGKIRAKAYVDSKLVAEADLMFMLVD